MDSEKLWKIIWNIAAVGFGIVTIYAGTAATKPPYNVVPFAIWTGLCILAKVIAEYGYDWFDL
jgi:hypothetical protein